jgi:hypothetical protein
MSIDWKDWIRELFKAAPVLTVVSFLLVVDFSVAAFGAFVDPTIVTGMPVWNKPMKFAISSGLYALSLAIVIRWSDSWKTALKVVDILTASPSC